LLTGVSSQVTFAISITDKFIVTNVGEIPRIVSLAWRTASSGTPGPVVLDFPIDVLFTPVEQDDIAWGNIMGGITSRPGPDPAAIKEVAGLLKSAQRPLVIVGTGARNVRLA
jgi:thiamine pyrophosphate-dependent acetolactate synthase large subunit-like protein